MKTAITYILCLFIALLPACQLLTPERRGEAARVLDEAYAKHEITKAQHDAGVEALENPNGFDWTALGFVGANIVLALLGGPAIVRLQRGQSTQKVGLPASKVRQGA